ncbi:MAG: 2-oxoacid:acceptor oxidoreductase family protein [Candidatus Zixiibacteriota bacterium]
MHHTAHTSGRSAVDDNRDGGKMYQGVIMSGFGGQGIISAGVLLAYSGMMDGKHVTFFPAYGAEMRGGTANCSVVVSTDEVASPVVSSPDSLIVMNEPSLLKFESSLKPQGFLLINKSLVSSQPKRTDVTIVTIDANKIAEEIGTVKCANMVMLGALINRTQAVSMESMIRALPKVFSHAKKEMLEMNENALNKGGTY